MPAPPGADTPFSFGPPYFPLTYLEEHIYPNGVHCDSLCFRRKDIFYLIIIQYRSPKSLLLVKLMKFPDVSKQRLVSDSLFLQYRNPFPFFHRNDVSTSHPALSALPAPPCRGQDFS